MYCRRKQRIPFRLTMQMDRPISWGSLPQDLDAGSSTYARSVTPFFFTWSVMSCKGRSLSDKACPGYRWPDIP